MSGSVALLVINPNSTASVTDGLRAILPPPPGVTLDFYTAPPTAPPAISDATTGVLSAAACFADISARGLLDAYDGFLVCCCASPPTRTR